MHAADGYARAFGKVGVCLVTSGPGATNTVTGIASAYMDSIPCGDPDRSGPTNFIGNDAFQEVDIVGITRPCTKHNYIVTEVEKLAATIQEAFHIARTGRPGPVLVDLPKNVIGEIMQFKMPPPTKHWQVYNPTYQPHSGQHQKGRQADAESQTGRLYSREEAWSWPMQLKN